MTYRNVPFLRLFAVLCFFQFSTMLHAAGVYEGERNTFNRFHGQGTYTYGNGKVYSGQWRDGRRHGKGEQTWANGDRYVGDWSGNRTHGKGVKTWINGDRYEGEWIGGKPSGTGHFTWANADEYTGGFVKGKRHGMGVFKSKTAGTYQGEWKDGQKHGKGSLTKPDGTKVTGQWKSDYLTGDVVFVFKGGDQYTGPTLNNLAHGEGVCKRSGKLSPCKYKKGRFVVKKVAKKVKPKPIVKPKVKPEPKVKPKVKPKVAKAEKQVATPSVVSGTSDSTSQPKVASSQASSAAPTPNASAPLVPTPLVPGQVATKTASVPPPKAAIPTAPSVAKPVTKPIPKPVTKPVVAKPLPVVPSPSVEEEPEAVRFARKGKHRTGSRPRKATKVVEASSSKPAFLAGPLRSDGFVFSFKHDWISHGYYDTAPTVWGKFDAIKFGDLKIRAEGGDYELTMVIDVYDGLGAYPLKYFKGVVSKPGVASYQTTSTLPGRVVIKYDDGKLIGGTFEFVAYRNGNQSSNEKRTIRTGEFLIPIVK